MTLLVKKLIHTYIHTYIHTKSHDIDLALHMGLILIIEHCCFVYVFSVDSGDDNTQRSRHQTQANINQFDLVSNTQYFFNGTYSFRNLDLVAQTTPDQFYYNTNDGILISASSVQLNCYGVKSDRGTTDGFLALPVTTQSTEFFVASWPLVALQLFMSLFANT